VLQLAGRGLVLHEDHRRAGGPRVPRDDVDALDGAGTVVRGVRADA